MGNNKATDGTVYLLSCMLYNIVIYIHMFYCNVSLMKFPMISIPEVVTVIYETYHRLMLSSCMSFAFCVVLNNDSNNKLSRIK